jgi:hypothetical protein
MRKIAVLLLLASAPLMAQWTVGSRNFAPPSSGGPPVTNLEAWYKADAGLTCTGGCSNGNSVTAWADQSSNGNNLACTSCGIYESSTVGGGSHSTVQLNGTSNFYTFGSALSQGAITVFVVIRLTSDSGDTTLLGGSPASWGYAIPRASGGCEQATGLTNIAWIGCGTTAPDTLWHQMNVTFDGTATTAFRLGESADGGSSASSVTTNPVTALGYSPAGGNMYFPGYIAEVLIYNAVLSSTNIGLVETYLRGKYGI